MTKHVGQKDLASLLGISARQVANLIDAGIPTRMKSGRRGYPWPSALHWYIKWKADAASKAKQPLDFAKARARKMEAEARLAELEAEEVEGRLIRYDVHERRIAGICDRLRGVLMTVPSKFLSRIQVTRTDLEAQAVGEQIRDELLRALQGTAGEIEDEDPELDELEDADPDAA